MSTKNHRLAAAVIAAVAALAIGAPIAGATSQASSTSVGASLAVASADLAGLQQSAHDPADLDW